jgi:PPOX class probable F420-dependent enzyme
MQLHAKAPSPRQATETVGSTTPIEGKYLSLTSYRRDGSGVATPVWFVAEDGRLLVVTDADSYKVRRIRRNHEVTVAQCTAMGRLRGAPIVARAEVLPESEGPHVEELMARKYRFDRHIILPIYRAVQWALRKRPPTGKPVYLAITPR